MGFPYLAPIKPWIRNILEERELNKNLKHLSSPFIILTSGAKVVKAKPYKDADEKEKALIEILESDKAAAYHGCIITNHSDSKILYETNETSLGYDFKGKKIVVEGETNRRVSPPIIEGLDIDTDGANNTLKTAKLTIKCFTLKQLEMFEVFFLKPGMNLLVEYGDNSLDRRAEVKQKNESEKIPVFDRIQRSGKISDGEYFNRIQDALIDKKDYKQFTEGFSDYFRATTDSLSTYLGKLRRTLGTYDLVAGKVTDFSFEVDENGIYTVNLDISQGNQMTLAIPLNQKSGQNSNNNAPATAGTPTYEQYLESISVDLNLPELKTAMAPESKWKNHLFNFGKLNIQQSDTATSNKPYISLHFIIEILMNYIVNINGSIDKNTFRFDIPEYYKDANLKQKIQCIPIFYHKNIISSSEDIIFPNKTMGNISVVKSDKTQISFLTDSTVDGSIGSGNSKLELRLMDGTTPVNDLWTADGVKIPKVDDNNKDMVFGNAANIFLNYIRVVEMWQKSGTRKEFLFKILDMVNDAGYGFYTLIYGNVKEGSLGDSATILDARGGTFGSIAKSDVYRFKPGNIKSNVRNFSFNFELSSLVAGRTVFNAQTTLMAAAKKTPKEQLKKLELPKEAYKSIDFSLYTNADGFYSINQIDYLSINKTWKEITAKPTGTVDPNKEKEDNEAQNLAEIIKSKSTKFKKEGGNVMLVYKDNDFLRAKMNATIKPKSTLAPIDITLEIDGLSGLSCGEYFEIDGVPEVYNQTGVFQITNTKHNVSSDGWKTTIEAGYRIVKKE
jgi:hypothetical protein